MKSNVNTRQGMRGSDNKNNIVSQVISISFYLPRLVSECKFSVLLVKQVNILYTD